jgi:hypothetical protein
VLLVRSNQPLRLCRNLFRVALAWRRRNRHLTSRRHTILSS